MATPAEHGLPASGARAPEPEPRAIRACLEAEVAELFDAEWVSVLEDAKRTQDLEPVHALLAKWRHFAHAELTDPGSYFRTLANATHIVATGAPRPGSATGDELRAHLQRRLRERQVYRLVSDSDALDQVAALPTDALRPYIEVLDALELEPWNGRPHHEANPAGAVRQWLFGPRGAGQVVYLILEDRREVHLLGVRWIG